MRLRAGDAGGRLPRGPRRGRHTAPGRLDLARGPLFRAGSWLLPRARRRLLLVVHHLVVDGVSWRVLLSDLEPPAATSGWRRSALPRRRLLAALRGEPRRDSRRATSRRRRSVPARLVGADEARRASPVPRPAGGARGAASRPSRRTAGPSIASSPAPSTGRRRRRSSARCRRAYRAGSTTLLLAALARAVARGREDGCDAGAVLRVDLEGHGRDETAGSRPLGTVGWLTRIVPAGSRLRGGRRGGGGGRGRRRGLPDPRRGALLRLKEHPRGTRGTPPATASRAGSRDDTEAGRLPRSPRPR